MTVGRRAPATRALAVVGLALGVMGLTGSLAFAQTEDPRGERFSGNASRCDQAGLGGETLEPDTDYTFTGGGSDDRFVSVTGLSDGVSVSGIVVKGGPAYNVYEPGERGLPEETPWEDLRSPLNAGGNIPTISHWFVCGAREIQPPVDPPIDPPPIDPPPIDPPIDPTDPGNGDPGNGDPGNGDPGNGDPGNGDDPGKGPGYGPGKGKDPGTDGGKEHGDDECPATSKEPCPRHDPRKQHDEETSRGLLPHLGI